MRERTVTRYLLEFTSVLRTLQGRVLVLVSRRLAVKAELLTCPAPFDVQTLGAGPVCLGLGGLHTTETISNSLPGKIKYSFYFFTSFFLFFMAFSLSERIHSFLIPAAKHFSRRHFWQNLLVFRSTLQLFEKAQLKSFKVISYIYDLHICTYNNHLHLNSISPEERFAALTGHGSEIKSKREISTDLTDLFPLVVCRFLIRFGLFRNWIFFESLMRHYRLQGREQSQFFV